MAFVTINHPDIEGTAQVSELALPHLSELGWRRVSGVPAIPTPSDPVAPEEGALKADWVSYAAGRGMPLAEAESATKADLIAVYAADRSN